MGLSRRYRNGFSLIEVVVVGVLIGVVGLALMSMLRVQQRGVASLTQRSEFDNLETLLRFSLSNPLTCPGALQNTSGSPVAPPTSLTKTSPSLGPPGIVIDKIVAGSFTLNSGKPYSHISIDKISLQQVVAGNPDPASLVPYTMTLNIAGTKISQPGTSAVGGGNLSLSIPLSVTMRAPAGSGPVTIVGCSSVSSAAGAAGTIEMVALTCDDYYAYGLGWNCVVSGNLSPTDYCISKGYKSATGNCKHDATAPRWAGGWQFAGEGTQAGFQLPATSGANGASGASVAGRWAIGCMSLNWQIPDFIGCQK